MITAPKTRLGLAVICVIGLFLLIALFYAVEDWRGNRAWNNYRKELEAKGETMDWKAFIPPPVPNEQNFFAAPKMAEWFIKPQSGNLSNELTAKLNIDHFRHEYCSTNLPIVAEITQLPIGSQSTLPEAPPDITLRFSALGNIFSIETNFVAHSNSPANWQIPLIQFENVPLTTAIENLARQAQINYMLDPQIGYGMPDADGRIKPEPQLSLRWTNVSCEAALLAILDNYDLQTTRGPKPDILLITSKTSHHLPAYLSIADGKTLHELWDEKMGTNAVGLQGQIFFASDPAHISPIHILCHSDTPVPTDDLADLFSQLFPDSLGRNEPILLQINPTNTNVFCVYMQIDSAADYLRWSDRFASDIELIREALKRPFTRMEGDYNDPIHIPIPNMATERSLIQMVAQRAECHLVEGDSEKAMAELALINESRRILEPAPTGKPTSMVAAVINIAVADLYLEAVRDGLQKHSWNQSQLTALALQLNQIDLATSLGRGLQHQQILTIQLMETYLFNAPHSWFVPKGWKMQNLVFAAKLNQQVIDAISIKDGLIKPFMINDLQDEIKNTANHSTPYSFLTVHLTPDLSKAVRLFAFKQATLNETKVACALERYHQVHEDYPETTDGLVPQFLSFVPPDPIDGRPLHYQRENDSHFLLYSIGWNEKDDHGTVGTSTDSENGDWVW